MTQKKAELEILTLLEAAVISLPRGRTQQQREAREFWQMLLQRLREDSQREAFLCLSDFVASIYNGDRVLGLPAWMWESTEIREKYLELAA